jgi:NAD(P)-dependent dehydrogenase (short-subunit alcohol dehydrogenase family)
MKAVVVTGAAGGLGQAICADLERDGWQVFAAVRSLESVTDLHGTPVELDVTSPETIARASQSVAAAVGPNGVHALVNNAGVSVDGPLELVTVDALRRQFEVNVIGQIAVTQAFLPALRAARGRIVNIGGAGGRLPLPMYGALSASKAALDSLTSVLRMELKHQGIAVSYIEPGALRTPFFDKAAEAARRDGYGSGADVQALYRGAIETAAEALTNSPASDVETAAKAVSKALRARRPRARYVVGGQARLGLLVLPNVPEKVRDRVLMSSLKLGPDAFTTGPPARII